MTLRYLSFGLLFSSLSAAGGGFQNGPQGARILGLGGASTAYTRDASVIFYNPGALGGLDSLTHISVGGLGTLRPTSFLGTNSFLLAEQETQPFAGGYLYATHSVTEKVSVGLSVNTPFGYDTRWPLNWEGRSVVQESRLRTVFVQPTAAYRINDNFSVGAGLVYAYGGIRQQRGLGQYDNPAAEAVLTGNGGGAGYNLGLYGRTSEDLSFGISFRSPLTLKMRNGEATFTGVAEQDQVAYPNTSGLSADVKLPGALSVGVANQLGKKTLITFDFTLTGWSRYDSVNFTLDKATPSQIKKVRRYEDAMAFRVGGEYSYSDALTLRAGVTYDESPVRDEYINPEFPDGNKLGGSLGLSWRLAEKISVDAGYSFEMAGQRQARINPSNLGNPNVSGIYRTQVHTAALGLSYSF
ncbi:outer membrane protein transport protein [Hymenobacter sp. BT175]|uniref:OmpP1/FadL family transporter n=1 Tax=Hymenobacter translucens TaxID=2886507 RepID=UPI001D0EE555|nr:outer membrane protein transport protein [Hymenobacter translucens]MCC2547023.1 outer membrane protein transport protein [Hymenobacter translucens]